MVILCPLEKVTRYFSFVTSNLKRVKISILFFEWGWYCFSPMNNNYTNKSKNNNKSPFDILGVDRFSTQKEIRRRYLELCKKHHPDVSNNKQVDFREITVAYELLTNHKKNNHIVASGGVNWEEAKQRSINTRLWTRNSYFVGFAIASLMIIYLSNGKREDKRRALLPHERNRQIYTTPSNTNTTTTTTNDIANDSVPPWQAAGTTFREWRKK